MVKMTVSMQEGRQSQVQPPLHPQSIPTHLRNNAIIMEAGFMTSHPMFFSSFCWIGKKEMKREQKWVPGSSSTAILTGPHHSLVPAEGKVGGFGFSVTPTSKIWLPLQNEGKIIHGYDTEECKFMAQLLRYLFMTWSDRYIRQRPPHWPHRQLLVLHSSSAFLGWHTRQNIGTTSTSFC